MIGHYVASAWRAICKAPFTTAANVLTLALGLACFVAAYGIGAYWKAGDSHHPGADRIVYVCTFCETGQPGEIQSPSRLAAELRNAMPDIEVVGRMGFPKEFAVSAEGAKAFIQGMPADPSMFDLFEFGFVEGGARTALQAPGSVVLTREAAQQLFGGAPALGRSLRIDGAWDATVSAVIAPSRQPSFLGQASRLGMLVNLDAETTRMFTRMGIPPAMAESWSNGQAETFVRLPPTVSRAAFQQRLDAFVARAIPRREDGNPEITLTAHPLGTLTASIVTARFFLGEDLGISASAVLVALGALILIVAAMNYSNLAAGQAAARVKEAGLRRVLGARRRQILAQHLVEAGMLTSVALVLAIVVVALAAPLFRQGLGADPVHFLRAGAAGPGFLAAIALLTTVAVGIWPAITLLRARPVDALGAGRVRSAAGGWLARLLVGLQFMSASFLAIVVVVLEVQHAHLRAEIFDPGADPVVVLNDLNQTGISPATLSDQLRSLPQVRAVTAIQFAPWSGSSLSRQMGRSGQPGSSGVRVMVKAVGPQYFDTFGREVLAGRVFDPARDAGGELPLAATDQAVQVVIDLALARSLGFRDAASAIGQPLHDTPADSRAPPGRMIATVAGVVESDFSQLNAVFGGSLFVFDPAHVRAQVPAVRIDGADVAGAMRAIQRVWDSMAPHLPLRAQFNDALFEQRYAPFRSITATFFVLSAAALLIAIVGILAVAVHVTARRRHEVGVRKTLGAGTGRVLRMLLIDLSKPVVIGGLLAWPLAWAVSQVFLKLFVHRAALSPAIFIATLLGVLLLAWAVVGGLAWRAARTKPALVLRTE